VSAPGLSVGVTPHWSCVGVRRGCWSSHLFFSPTFYPAERCPTTTKEKENEATSLHPRSPHAPPSPPSRLLPKLEGGGSLSQDPRCVPRGLAQVGCVTAPESSGPGISPLEMAQWTGAWRQSAWSWGLRKPAERLDRPHPAGAKQEHAHLPAPRPLGADQSRRGAGSGAPGPEP
jgi:hypothetical protein